MVTRTLNIVIFGSIALYSLAIAGQPANIRPVNLSQLQDQIRTADRIEVVGEPFKDAKVLFASSDPKDREDLIAAILIDESKGNQHCMCEGSPILRLYQNGKPLIQISNHHGFLLRCTCWTSDAPIKDQEKWLHWFDVRGMPGPRREVEDMAKQEAKQQAAHRKWEASIPPCIKPLWQQVPLSTWGINGDIKPLQEAMLSAYPDQGSRILALLSWFGAGEGPWTGVPAYEYVPEKLLMEYSTAELLAAANTRELTSTELEGLARCFAGWMFNRQRPRDLALVPQKLKERLLTHVLSSMVVGSVPVWTDEDKKTRAQHAFSK